MTQITWLLLAAAFLPFIATVAAKAGGKGFNNNNPRPWLSSLDGWPARANAAQMNLFEGLPFFYAAVLFALYKQADIPLLTILMLVWVVVRLAYIAAYIADYASIRSLLWFASFVVNIALLFS